MHTVHLICAVLGRSAQSGCTSESKRRFIEEFPEDLDDVWDTIAVPTMLVLANCGRGYDKHGAACAQAGDPKIDTPLAVHEIQRVNGALTGADGPLDFREVQAQISCDGPMKICETSATEAGSRRAWGGPTTRGTIYLDSNRAPMTVQRFQSHGWTKFYDEVMTAFTGKHPDRSPDGLQAAVDMMNKVRADPEHWGNKQFPAPQKVEALVKDFFDWYNRLLTDCTAGDVSDSEISERVTEVLIRFVEIHPSLDGDGRTARALESTAAEVCYGLYMLSLDSAEMRNTPFSSILHNTTRIAEALGHAYRALVDSDATRIIPPTLLDNSAALIGAEVAAEVAPSGLRPRRGPGGKKRRKKKTR